VLLRKSEGSNTQYAIRDTCIPIAESMTTTETLLQQGIVAAQAGRREEARALLMQVVQADERSEQGWLWLAGVVEDPDDMRTCLENVLDLNPGNTKARQGLAWIESHYGRRAAPEPTPEPTVAPTEPQESAANTGPTARLVPEVAPVAPIPAPSPPQPALHTQLPPDEAPASVVNPCPYCGTSTLLSQRSCLQCHNGLLIRTAPREKRSVSTTILAILWGISGVFTCLSGLAIIGVAFYVQSASGRNLAREAGLPRLSLVSLLLPGIVVLLFGGLGLAITRGLLRRVRWAYVLHVVLTVLSALLTVLNIVFADRLATSLPANRAQALGQSAGSTASLFCNVLFLIIYILLTFLSFRDFYGPMVRFQPEVDVADHMGHYNNGVTYKNRGMWYMATREWEAAVAKAPRDLGYLHALGLAYAQIKQFSKARATLDTALSVAPDDPRLRESRALVDQLAAAQR
jgi:Flp pilus assembly protein TadD